MIEPLSMQEWAAYYKRQAFADGAQALEVWAWVERTGHAPEGHKREWQCYGANGYGDGPTQLAAVLDAMEKEGKG